MIPSKAYTDLSIAAPIHSTRQKTQPDSGRATPPLLAAEGDLAFIEAILIDRGTPSPDHSKHDRRPTCHPSVKRPSSTIRLTSSR
jgi:hypothetical protein